MAEEKAPAAAKKKTEGKTKQPSALKRDLQNEKKRLRNRSYRASVLTSIRSLQSSLDQKEAPEAIKTKYQSILGNKNFSGQILVAKNGEIIFEDYNKNLKNY